MSDIELSATAVEELKIAVRKAIIKKGQVVREDGGNTFGWEDWDVTFDPQARRIALSAVTINDPLEDAEWMEFVGTFEDSRTKYGVQVTVTLNKRHKQTWRFEGRMGELIQEILS